MLEISLIFSLKKNVGEFEQNQIAPAKHKGDH